MKRIGLVMLAFCVPALVSLAGEPRTAQRGEGGAQGPQKAVAVLHPLGDSKVMGTVYFTVEEGSVHVTGEITGLTPGEHAFHVHEFGDCSDPKGMSSGAHFNPTHMPHGGPHSDKRHVGDLGNIKADDSGKVTLDIKDTDIQLHGPHSIVGRALIVHAKADDLTSQPSGNAGDRIACAVIGIANPKTASASAK
jgi:Cu-Zn family superoxide dismutase